MSVPQSWADGVSDVGASLRWNRELWARKKPHEHVAYVLLWKRGVLSHQADSRLRGQHQAFLNRRSQETAIIAGPSIHIVLRNRILTIEPAAEIC